MAKPDRESSAPRPPHAGVPVDRLDAGQLAEAIRWHNHAYFTLAQPIISDAEFDSLVGRLRQLQPDHPALLEVGAPPVAGEPTDKVEHRQPMLSLEKCNAAEEFFAWLKGAYVTLAGKSHQSALAEDVWRWAQGEQARLVATPKIDGLACSILYDAHGELVLAATRGDGRIGENVTHNVRKLPTVPGKLTTHRRSHAGQVEVRGEVYLPLSIFRTVADQYANPRNLAAGTLKAKDNPALPPEKLLFFVYDVLGPEFATETAKFEFAREAGFTPAPWQACQPAEAEATFQQFVESRDDLDYEADGVVLKFDDTAVQRRLGITSHHPRGAIAWKFIADSGLSTLQEIEWSVSRTGTITPVAMVAPVQLSGASVTRATLHNLSNVRRLGLRLGDSVELVRRGGVIPHLERTLGGGEVAVQPPALCPSCGSPTREVLTTRRVAGQDVTTVILMCSEPENCTVARHRQVLHYAATLEMEGFGEKAIDVLMEAGIVQDAADLYTLKAGDLEGLPRFGKTMAGNLLNQVEKKRTVELATFLRALGIDTLGKHAAALLAGRWTLDEIRTRTVEEVAGLHSLGEITAGRIVEGLREAAPLIDELLQHVTIVRAKAEAAGQGPLVGQVVVFTGKLERMNRRDAQQRVMQLGGLAGDSVTHETTQLVVAADELDAPAPSSKLKKARKLQEQGGNIEIVAEHDFWARLDKQAEGA